MWLHVIIRFFSSQTSILFFETFFSNVAEKRLSINRHECAAPCFRSMNLFFSFFSFLSNLGRIPSKNQRNIEILPNFYDLLLKFRFVLMGRTNIFMMSREVEGVAKNDRKVISSDYYN